MNVKLIKGKSAKNNEVGTIDDKISMDVIPTSARVTEDKKLEIVTVYNDLNYVNTNPQFTGYMEPENEFQLHMRRMALSVQFYNRVDFILSTAIAAYVNTVEYYTFKNYGVNLYCGLDEITTKIKELMPEIFIIQTYFMEDLCTTGTAQMDPGTVVNLSNAIVSCTFNEMANSLLCEDDIIMQDVFKFISQSGGYFMNNLCGLFDLIMKEAREIYLPAGYPGIKFN